MTQRPLDSDQNISSVNAQVQELQKRTVLAGPADKAVFVFLSPPPPVNITEVSVLQHFAALDKQA